MTPTTGSGTVRHRRRKDVRAPDERLLFQARMLDAIGQAVIATDIEGRVLYWNRAAEALYGWSAEQALGCGLSDLVEAESSRDEAAGTSESAADAEGWTGELLVRRRDGTLFPARLTRTPIHDEAGEVVGIVTVSSDESARRQLEEQLRQALKMEAVGRLAAGIAHDFNNILTAIYGSADFLLGDLGHLHPSRADVEQIQQAAMRAASLVRQLMAYGRRQMLRPQVLDLNAKLSEMLELLSRVIGEDVRLVREYSATPPLVRADPAQLEQVVLNLCINARAAMPEGGTLTIELSHREFDAPQPRGYGDAIPPGAYVQLSVSDTGHGISEEILPHIFEPFFTTREPGKGTGLGLPTVYGIVRQSEGFVDLRSRPGEGTTFDVFLPRITAASETLPPERRVARASPGSETILLAEDEEIVRLNTRRVLERGGYVVLEASDGEDALQVFEANASRIDVLVTDLAMPRLSGQELAHLLHARVPSLPILCISGYMDERTFPWETDRAKVTLLEKPFAPATLLGKLREVLHAG